MRPFLLRLIQPFGRILVKPFDRANAAALLYAALIAGVVFTMWSSTAWAQTDATTPLAPTVHKKLLPVEQVFVLTVDDRKTDELQLTWRIAPGYYLYKDRFKVSSDAVRLPALTFTRPAKLKDDPTFGRVAVFHQSAEARLHVNSRVSGVNVAGDNPPQTVPVRVSYQGCAESGLCYPPVEQVVTMAVSADKIAPSLAAKASTPNSSPPPTNTTLPQPVSSVSPPLSLPNASDSNLAVALTRMNIATMVLTLLLLGFGLSLTPCVYPMFPILSSVLARANPTEPTAHTGQSRLTPWRGFALALAYVLGMAMVYALVGSLMGALGARANVALWLQQPSVIIAFAGLFVLLALSMFGWFELRLPSRWQTWILSLSTRESRLHSGQPSGASLRGAWFMGALSSLVVSPCVSAPLVGVLTFISTTGRAGIGAVALFALAIGMGLPLLVLGLLGGRYLPRAGAWMNVVKMGFGIGLLMLALAMVQRIVPIDKAPWMLVAWAGLWLGTAALLWRLALDVLSWGRIILRLLVLGLLTYVGLLLYGAYQGKHNPWSIADLSSSHRSSAATQQQAFTTITSINDLNLALDKARLAGQPAMVDLAASWCASCLVMERTTYVDAAVIKALDGVVLLRLDISDTTEAHRAWMSQHAIFGPPTVLFYAADGQELTAQRITGEVDASAFLAQMPRW